MNISDDARAIVAAILTAAAAQGAGRVSDLTAEWRKALDALAPEPPKGPEDIHLDAGRRPGVPISNPSADYDPRDELDR